MSGVSGSVIGAGGNWCVVCCVRRAARIFMSNGGWYEWHCDWGECTRRASYWIYT